MAKNKVKFLSRCHRETKNVQSYTKKWTVKNTWPTASIHCTYEAHLINVDMFDFSANGLCASISYILRLLENAFQKEQWTMR